MKFIIEVLTALSILIGGVIWLTTLDQRTRVVAGEVKKVDRIYNDMIEIKHEVGIIQGKQDVIINHLIKAKK